MRSGTRFVFGAIGLTLAGAHLTFAGGDCSNGHSCTLIDACEIVDRVLEGDPAPGTKDDFQTFDRPNISETGSIAFGADTDGPTNADDVVYVDSTLIAKEGEAAPGTPGQYSAFEFFETGHQVNAVGDLGYIATLRNVPAGQTRAVYRNADLIAQSGMPADGIAGRNYDDFGFVGVADDGTVGYRADLDGGTSDDSVIYYGGAVLYRQGQPVPGMMALWDGDFDELQWNGNGDLLFEGNTTLGGGMDMVVFRRRTVADAVIEDVVAQEGQPVAANDGPDFLELILQTSISEAGQWGLRGNLGVAPSDSDAVILTECGFYRQQGESVNEVPGAVLGNFNGVDINSRGDVLYLADIEGAADPDVDEGLFLNCCLLFTTGQQVPGLPAGTEFSDIGFEDMYVNDSREIVFAANYTGAVVGDGVFTVSCPLCLGDIDESGDVNTVDLLALLSEWGDCEGETPLCFCAADLNLDGEVSVNDLLTLLANWGDCL